MALPSGIAFWLGTVLLHQCRELPGAWLMLAIGVIAATMLVYWYRAHVSLAAWVAAMLAGMCWTFIVAEQRLQWELPLALERQDIPVIGYITSLPERQAGGQRFVMQTHQIDRQAVVTRILLTWYGGDVPDLRIGDEWRFTVRLKRPHGFANPGGFDRETWLFQQGIRATGYVRVQQSYQVTSRSAWAYPIGRLRQWLAQQIERVLPGKPLLGFIQALVLGKRDHIDAEQWRVLSLTGTSHLMAISGLHISLIAGLGFALAHWGWRRYARGCLWIPAARLGAWVGLTVATVYATLAGFAIPTQRALVMVAVLMLVHGGVRQTSSTQGLGLALWAVLLYDPLASLAVGFYLSFAAVGLIFYAMMGRTTQRLTWWRTLRLQWWISIGLLPLTLYFFQQTPWLSFFANIWAIPWVSFIVVPLSLSGSVMVGWPIGEWLLLLAHMSVSLLWWGLERLAHDSLNQWFASPPGLWGAIVMLAGLLLLGLPKGMPLRWVGWFWLTPVLAWPVNLLPAGVARLTVLDVGQGLAALVQTRHHTLLFDTGPKWGEGSDAGRSVIVPFLRRQGVKQLDRLIISHGHYDHVGGLHSLLQQITVKDIWSSEPEQFTQLHMRHCLAGQRWQWDEVTFHILYPDRRDSSRGNDNSCVLRIDSRDQGILLTADIERRAERRLIESAGNDLAAQVMVAPHHGSKTSSTPEFVAAVQPRYVLLPLGYLNRFGFPHSEVVGRYKKLGAKWFATGYHGALTVIIGMTDEVSPPTQYRLQHGRYWYNDSHKRDYLAEKLGAWRLESKVNYTIVGLFVLILSIAALAVVFFFSARYNKDYATYLVIMQEASGLSLRAPVKFNGVEVGYVENISLNHNNPQQVILKLQIEKDVSITTSTYASLTAQGVTGVSYVGLKATSPAAPLLETQPGQKYPIIPAEASLFEDLENTLRQVSEDIASVGDSLSQMFDQNSTVAMQDTFLNLQAFTDALAESTPDLDASIRNAAITLANLAKASEVFPSVAKNLEYSLSNIENAVLVLGNTLSTLDQQAMPVTVELLQKLDTIAVSLDELTAQMGRQPGVLLRGKRTPSPGPGE